MIEPAERIYKFNKGYEKTTLIVSPDTIEIYDSCDRVRMNYKKIVKITTEYAIIQIDDNTCIVIKEYMMIISVGNIIDYVDGHWVTENNEVIIYLDNEDERYGWYFYSVKMKESETVSDTVDRFLADTIDGTVKYYNHDHDCDDNCGDDCDQLDITETQCSFKEFFRIEPEDYVRIDGISDTDLYRHIIDMEEARGYVRGCIPNLDEWNDYCDIEYLDANDITNSEHSDSEHSDSESKGNNDRIYCHYA